MKIGVAQMETSAGDLEKVMERLRGYASIAAKEGVDLVVFPMAALCGVTPVQNADREGFLLDLMEALAPTVEDLPCPCLIPMVLNINGTPQAEALLVEGDSIRPVRLSARLDAMRKGRPGADLSSDILPEIDFHGARLGVAFTYEDLDAYDNYEYDVNVIVFLSGYGFASDDPSSALGLGLREGRFVADAEATGAWIVGAGSLGCYDAQVFCGSSFVLAPWGELAAQALPFEEDFLIYDIDPSAEGPLPNPLTLEIYDSPLVIWQALNAALTSLVWGFSATSAGIVVGHALPDALLALLAVDALGPMNVWAVVPETNEREADEECLALVRALRIPEENVERVDVRGAADERAACDLAQLALAALARRERCVPLGSRDKTGWALETQEGALSAARIEPFADLYRSKVVELARLRSMISPIVAPRLLASFQAPEVPGIEGAFDTEEAALEFVDVVLESYVEWERPISDIVAERGHGEAALAVIARLRELEARRPARPRAPRLSSRTLDEACAPLGFAWRDRLRDQSERMSALMGSVLAGGVVPDDEQQGVDLSMLAPTSGEINDIIGHLRDFSLGGAFSDFGLGDGRDQGPSEGLPGDPRSRGPWPGPFSEN